MRTFIGRSQEGEGAVEAKLCTSTSGDDCELFTKGDVQRVFGRPSILELVNVNRNSETTTASTGHSADELGLFLSRNYFQDRVGSENQEWKRVTGTAAARSHHDALGAWPNAPSPASSSFSLIK
jgi:hypothetical protein